MGGNSTKEERAPRSSAGFGRIEVLLHPQLGSPLVLVARPWHGTTVVTVVVGAGGPLFHKGLHNPPQVQG